ncbi:hypothetical protein DRW07_06620 [Alteromonas sediminis]|uniref:PTS system glucose-specific EIIA component n=1 Tax=Alteromonas sediminis TaxID=2259342 RepID=A0A3N5Y381_9ALTE|nr:PTS glucose transporter subunit IIA [Alteromonas sediminis]RPJ67206.1 hypothetical protein DRW07_06620 [Alteromonas sediminis]
MMTWPSLLTLAAPETFSHELVLASPMAGRVVALSSLNEPALSQEMWGCGVAINTRATVCSVPFDGIVESADLTRQRWVLKARNGLRVMIQIGVLPQSLYAERLQPQLKPKQKFTQGQILTYLDPVWLASQLGELYCVVTLLSTKQIIAAVPNRLDQHVDAMDDLLHLYLNITKTR